MSSISDSEIISDASEIKGAEVWWYRRAEQTDGPVADEHIQALLAQKVIDRSTLVWREDFGQNWKRLDETTLWRKGRPIPPEMPSYDPKWQKVFDAASIDEKAWTIFNRSGVRQSYSERLKFGRILQSIPGFIFGPFYYFYLRMWRKGLYFFALLPVLNLAEEVTGTSRIYYFAIPALCAVLAKRDYYRFCVKGEKIWPFLRFSKNIYTDLAIVLGISLAVVVAIVLLPDDVTSAAAARPTVSVRDRLSVIKRPDGNGTYKLVITSKTNSLLVKSVKINRGTCQSQTYSLPQLGFGETSETLAMCNPIEAEVDTNFGAVTFSWPR